MRCEANYAYHQWFDLPSFLEVEALKAVDSVGHYKLVIKHGITDDNNKWIQYF